MLISTYKYIVKIKGCPLTLDNVLWSDMNNSEQLYFKYKDKSILQKIFPIVSFGDSIFRLNQV